MKVRIGNYPGRLTCDIFENHMNRKYGLFDWPKKQTWVDNFLEGLDDLVQSAYNVLNYVWFDRQTRKISVRIDRYDTYCMSTTLTPIILPMLKQLRDTKNGAPLIDNSDVPENLHRPTGIKDHEIDENHFKRWDYVLEEMIWAFEQKNREDWVEDYISGDCDLIVDDNGTLVEGENYTYKTDDEGMKLHQSRMSNGFRLFGKFFENLWD